jgi:NADH-quinone oxidoreductase subunit N
VVALYQYQPQYYFASQVSHDHFSLFFKLFFIVATFFTLLFAYRSYEIAEDRLSEFILLTLAVTVGMSTLVASINMLTLYLSLELVSIVSYALAGFRKKNNFSNEAALKYLLYGAFASGTMLYGFSLLYGLTGTLNLYSINASLSSAYIDPVSLYAILFMILFGFGFKMSAVPFHMWAPDVYQGAPTPTAAFLTVAPKVAGFAVFIRFFFTVFSNNTGTPGQWDALPYLDWPMILAILSALTMTLGNLSALFQKNAKRMLAYSSIAHAGYMLMGLVVLNNTGLAAVLFYAVVYFLMNFGAFFVVGLVANTYKSEEISNFRGLGWKSPLIAISMAIFLFSLTGLPPFGGFIGKVYLIWALVEKEIYWLIIFAIINTVISLYYYAYIAREMFLEKPADDKVIALTPLSKATLLALVIPTIVLGLYWNPLITFISKSLQFVVIP